MSTPTSHFCSGFTWSPVNLLARSWVCPHKPTHGADTGICIRTRKGLQAWSKLRKVLGLLCACQDLFQKASPQWNENSKSAVSPPPPPPVFNGNGLFELLQPSSGRTVSYSVIWSSSFVHVAYIFLFATDYVNWLWSYCLCQQVSLVFITHFFLFLGVGNCTGSRTALETNFFSLSCRHFSSLELCLCFVFALCYTTKSSP